MSSRRIFDRIDTVILPVTDYQAAAEWYATTLGLEVAFTDPHERLAVLSLPAGVSLTVWEQRTAQRPPQQLAASPFPIFATDNASEAIDELRRRGARVGELQEGTGVRFFTFHDPDGNRLEACQVLETPVAHGA